MMPAARLEHVLAMRGGFAARRADHHRRALVARLIDQRAGVHVGLLVLPGALELGLAALRAVALKELAVDADALGDEILGDLLEDRPALFAVGLEQRFAAPALKLGGK